MANKETILSKIEEIIQTLSGNLPPSDIAGGWTQESQMALLEFFQQLKSKILAGEKLRYMSIPRWMDQWGITAGPLIEKAAFISLELNKIYHPES